MLGHSQPRPRGGRLIETLLDARRRARPAQR
jgi:hypothetical protein